MITIWGVPVVATVEQVLKDIKLELYGTRIITHDLSMSAEISGNSTVASPVNTATVITINQE